MYARFRNLFSRTLPLAAAVALAVVTVSEARADAPPPNVIELFTSQGCSSCPPADELLGKLAERKGSIALTFPVDYWDYLGWKDTLASPAYSKRQRDYARARGDGQVYTPQAVINGVEHAVGSREADIERLIEKSRRTLAGLRIPLRVWTEGDELRIEVGDAPAGTRVRPATIWLALVKKSETVKIERGENRGRTITYHHVVRDLTPVGHWTGKSLTLRLPKHHLQSTGNDGCTVLLQQDAAGPILAAAALLNW
ncbi:MAG: DUF1223 domain-containing protein [Methyloligellaceae bacterium]